MPTRSILLALAIVILLAPTPVFASVLLSEVQVTGAKASDEFVEIYNTGDAAVNLSGYSLRRKSAGDVTAKGSSLKTFGATDVIPAESYFLWGSSSGIYATHADTTTGGGLSDNNSLALYDKAGGLIDSLTWGSGHALPFSPTLFGNPKEKEGLTRDLGTLTWSVTQHLTPTNAKGEVFIDESGIAEAGPSPYKIVINEILPNPKEKGDAGEFIELYNPSNEAVDLSSWEIHDASATGKYVFPNGASISSLGYLVVTDKEFSLSLNNSNETLSLYDKEKRLVHQVRYEKTKEGVSLNLVGGALRGARKPTPGAVNSENTDPVTKERVPKKGYRGFAIELRARGKDSDGDKLKFSWDFGDGHKSYKESTTHKYLKSGCYTITLTTDDGIDTTKETFEIKIEKYRAPKVRIVSFVPNPKGNDSDLEWVEIENREKREVNLKGFSIATGTKKKSITNHPIREDFVIPAKSVKRLTREQSLFTLGNVQSYVELRAPDGTVVQDLKYKFEKSLADDTVLKKEKGKGLMTVSAPLEPDEPETTEAAAPTLSGEEIKSEPTAALPSTEEATVPARAEGMLPEDIPSLQEEASQEPEESDESFGLVSLLQKIHQSRATFPFSLFQFDISEDKNALTYWQGALNTVLNDWLNQTSVATTEPE